MYPHTNRRKNNDAKINNKCSNEDKNNNNVNNYSTESVTQSEQENFEPLILSIVLFFIEVIFGSLNELTLSRRHNGICRRCGRAISRREGVFMDLLKSALTLETLFGNVLREMLRVTKG